MVSRILRDWRRSTSREKPLLSERSDLYPVVAERAEKLVGVAAVARLDQELDLGRSHRGGAEDPLMLHLDDVAAGGGDQSGDLGEAAGDVGHGDAQAHQARIPDQAAHQYRGED